MSHSKFFLKEILKSSVLFISSRIPFSILRIIGRWANVSQGKGWGSTSVFYEVKAILSLLDFQNIKNLIIFDVGANKGDWTTEGLKIFKEAHFYCFEPSTHAFTLLSDRFKHCDQVSSYNFALGSKIEKLELYSDKPGSGFSSLLNRRMDHFGKEFFSQEIVEVKTLDDFIEQESVKPDILKIDVEGFELQVLKGCSKYLKEIKIIQFEFGGCNIDSRTYFQDFYYFFIERNFEIFRLSPRGLKKIDKYSENDEIFDTTNFICLNKSRN